VIFEKGFGIKILLTPQGSKVRSYVDGNRASGKANGKWVGTQSGKFG